MPLSPDEFGPFCRELFAYLVEDHGFIEDPITDRPWRISFGKNGGRILIGVEDFCTEGAIYVAAPSGEEQYFPHLIPRGHGKEHRSRFGVGIAGDLRYLSLCLQEFGGEFLQGDWSGVDALRELGEKLWEESAEAAGIGQRRSEAHGAAESAATLFLDGDYAQVVRLLAPHEDYLTPAQQMKLRIARERSQA